MGFLAKDLQWENSGTGLIIVTNAQLNWKRFYQDYFQDSQTDNHT